MEATEKAPQDLSDVLLRHMRAAVVITCAHRCGLVTAGDSAAEVLDEAITHGWGPDEDGDVLCPSCLDGTRGACEVCAEPSGAELWTHIQESLQAHRKCPDPQGTATP